MVVGTIRKCFLAIAAICFASALSAGAATATPISFTGSSGNLTASATFDTSGSNLIVTLTNTSLSDVLVPTDVLTAVFFDIGGDPALTPVSAVICGTCSVLFAPAGGSGPNVGGEWAYVLDEGISSSGLGIFGPGDRFPGSNLQGPDSPDGLQYGITSAGDDPATGNAAVTGGNALIKNSVNFTLSGLPAGFDPSTAISNVVFQYGTSLEDPHFPGNPPSVPEPATLGLMGIGLLGIGAMWRRR